MVSFLEGQLRSRIVREERKKVLLKAKLSDDASDTEDVDLSSLQDAEKDSAEMDPPPQHINCHVLQPAQEDHDGVTSELGVLQWHEEDGPDAITAPEPAYQQLLQLGLVLEHQGARKEVLKLLFFTVWRGQGAAPALAAAQLMTYYEQLPETGEALWVPTLADMLEALVALGYRDPSLTTRTSPGQAAAATHTRTQAPCTRHPQAAAVPEHPCPASSPRASLRRSQRGSAATAVGNDLSPASKQPQLPASSGQRAALLLPSEGSGSGASSDAQALLGAGPAGAQLSACQLQRLQQLLGCLARLCGVHCRRRLLSLTGAEAAAGSLLNALLLLLSSPVGGGPLLLELSQALSALVAAWGAEGRAAAGRDPEGVAWRAAAAAAAVTVSRAGPSYQAGLRIIQALPPTSPQLVQLKQECALSLLQQLCRQAPPSGAPDPSGGSRLGGRPKEASINLTMARHVMDLLEGVAKNPLKLVYHVDDLECKGHPRSLNEGKARAVAGASYYRAMAMLECALAVLWPLLTASPNQDGIAVCSQFLQYLQGVNNTPPRMKDPASMSFLAKVSKMVNRVQHVLGEANS